MAEFDDDMVLGQLRDLLRNRSVGNTPRSKPDEFKANDLPEFAGGADPEVYLEWERKIERLFDFKELPDEKRCKYAILRLSKSASLWYEGEKKKRARAGKEKITSWESLKRKLRKRFVPNTHRMTTYRKIAELRQGKSSIGEYIDEFEGLSLMGEIEEIEEQKMARFLRGMNPSIAHSVELYPYSDFDTLCSLSTKIEAQGRNKFGGGTTAEPKLTNPWAKSSPTPSAQTEGSSGSLKTPNHTSSATPKPTEASKETSLSRMRCFKCQGFGHLQHSCPNKRIVTLREAISWEGFQSADEQDDQVFGYNEEDGGVEEFEAPPYNTNLMLRTLPYTDEMEQGVHHSSMPLLIGKHLPESEGSSQPEGRSPTPSDGKATDLYNATAAKEASQRITLQSPNGSNWQAEISETIPKNFLSAGWSNFVEDHSLKENDFLVFGCNGNMHLNGMLLGTSACERQDLFEMKTPKNPVCSLPIPSTIPYILQQVQQEEFGLTSVRSLFDFLSPVSDLRLRSFKPREFSRRLSSVAWVRLCMFDPRIFVFKPQEFRKDETDHEAVRTNHADVRTEFKEEPPPSNLNGLPTASTTLGIFQTEAGCSAFGLRQSGFGLVIIDCPWFLHLRPSTFGSIAFDYLRISMASDVSLRSLFFNCLRCTPGDRAPTTLIVDDLTPLLNDNHFPELRTILFKGGGNDANMKHSTEEPAHHGFEELQFKIPWSVGFSYIHLRPKNS